MPTLPPRFCDHCHTQTNGTHRRTCTRCDRKVCRTCIASPPASPTICIRCAPSVPSLVPYISTASPLPSDPVTTYADAVVSGRILANKWVRLACQRHLDDLKRDDLYFDAKKAQQHIDFFRLILRLSGSRKWEGRPFILLDFQEFIQGSVFGWYWKDASEKWVDSSGDIHYRRRRFEVVYFEAAKGLGKALALDTPIPTPSGWTTMGELAAGDSLFNSDGDVIKVKKVTPVMYNRECYRLVFDDGESIVADADHLWLTNQRHSCITERFALKGLPKKEWGKWKHGIRTTKYINETLRYKNGNYQSANHSVELCYPLDLPENNDTPIHPYVLGVWLGDGDSDCARITVSDKDVELLSHLRDCGVEVGERRKGGSADGACGRYTLHCDIRTELREAGLLHNKHIPASYLRGSRAQRLDLLQGLMDTDGTASKNGDCCLTTTNERLATSAYELVVSLGMKCFLREGKAKLYGRVIGKKWEVGFYPPPYLPVFRLKRKLVRQFRNHNRVGLSEERRIVACDKVKSVPVRCIEVDDPTGMFLVGRGMIPTHNSPLAAGTAIFCAIGDGVPRSECFCFASKKDQAYVTFKFVLAMIEQSPLLKSRFLKTGEKKCEQVTDPKTKGSYIKPIASDDKKSGPTVHCAIGDEVHEQADDVVLSMMRQGMKGENPLLYLTTNSGTDRTSVCWQQRLQATQMLEGKIPNDSLFAYICGLDDEELKMMGLMKQERGEAPIETQDPIDFLLAHEELWIKANPAVGRVASYEYVRKRLTEAKGLPAQRNRVLRLQFCVWTDSQTVWIPDSVWMGCADLSLATRVSHPKFGEMTKLEEELIGKRCYMGMDLAHGAGFHALELIFPDDEGRMSQELLDLRLKRGDTITAVAIEGEEGEEDVAEKVDLSPSVKDPNNQIYTLLEYFFMDREAFDTRAQEQSIFHVWREDGDLEVWPEIVALGSLLSFITGTLMTRYTIEACAYDPAFVSPQMALNLEQAGLKMVTWEQQYRLMHAPIAEAERRAKVGLWRHRGHPIMRWMMGNVNLETDRGGRHIIDKRRLKENVDGPSALATGLGWCMRANKGEEKGSVYERRGVLVFEDVFL